MNKTEFIHIRTDPCFKQQVVETAKECGMSTSELIRLALRPFFTHDVDSKPHCGVIAPEPTPAPVAEK